MKKVGSANQPKINGSKSKKFNISVKLPSDEVFPVKNVWGEMKIKQLKGDMEFHCGLPYHLQKLHYLDEACLMEETDLRHNEVVPGAVLRCDVWPMWSTLLEAVATNDMEWLFRLGVTQNSDYRTPHSDYMTVKTRRAWIAERAAVALVMAVHRGHLKMIEKLIAGGADVNARTSLGRTPLHIAAGIGNGKAVDLLLQKGADFNMTDNEGNTASMYAARFGHKDCERHIFLFQWQQRATNMKPEFQNLPRMAHQYHDSKFPVWLNGPEVQLYCTNILPPGEYGGTSLSAPKKRHRPTTAPSGLLKDKQVQLESVKDRSCDHSRGQSRESARTNGQQDVTSQGRSSRSATWERVTAPPRRRGVKELTDPDVYGLVEIDNKEERENKINSSNYGRALAYSRLYNPKQASPASYDEWVRRKQDEKRQELMKLKQEQNSEDRKAEERRTSSGTSHRSTPASETSRKLDRGQRVRFQTFS